MSIIIAVNMEYNSLQHYFIIIIIITPIAFCVHKVNPLLPVYMAKFPGPTVRTVGA